MLKYSLRKVLAIIPKFFVITVILFVLLELSPGDPLSRRIDPISYNLMSDEIKEAYRESLGLNRPAIERYFSWLFDLMRGDFGYSITFRKPIAELIAVRLPYSMELQFGSLVLSAIIGTVLGFLCAVFQRTAVDYATNTVTLLGISLPDYFFAILFMMLFGVILGWFPVGGRMPTDIENPTILQRLPYMVLPIGSMTFTAVCGYVRYTRMLMVEIMNKDYVKTARAKGLPESAVNIKHCLRNALGPLMVSIVARLPQLVGGSIVIEQVFNYLGVGALSLSASQTLDAPVALFNITVAAVITLLASTLMDIVVALLDPRVRFE